VLLSVLVPVAVDLHALRRRGLLGADARNGVYSMRLRPMTSVQKVASVLALLALGAGYSSGSASPTDAGMKSGTGGGQGGTAGARATGAVEA
jgi:hypothetical protein